MPSWSGTLALWNLHSENQSLRIYDLRIYEQVSLSAANLLSTVVAPLLATDPARLGRLRIYYPGAGLRLSP